MSSKSYEPKSIHRTTNWKSVELFSQAKKPSNVKLVTTWRK